MNKYTVELHDQKDKTASLTSYNSDTPLPIPAVNETVFFEHLDESGKQANSWQVTGVEHMYFDGGNHKAIVTLRGIRPATV